MISTNAVAEQAQLFQVAAASNGFNAKVLEDMMKVSVKSGGEIIAEATTLVAGAAEAKPVLAHFREEEPLANVTHADRGIDRHIAEEFDVSNDLVVECIVFGLIAVKQEERVDEYGQIVDERDIE